MKLLFVDHKTKEYTDYFGDKEDLLIDSDELRQELKLLKNDLEPLMDRTARDTGTCVMGAGIALRVFPNARAKKWMTLIVFRAPFQGNIGSHQALKPILKHLQEKYPEAGFYWEDGRMD